MKLLSTLIIFAASMLVAAQDITPADVLLPGFPTIPLKLIPEYVKLYNMCQDSNINGTYVAVRYGDNDYTTFKYNQCYPYAIDGNEAEMAVFCKSVTCYSNPNPDCTGGAVPPVPVPLVAKLFLVNVADFVQLLGQGATCQQNGIPPPL
ncbi:hypothetical protein BDQ17DRAFT_1331771 [Cyathus striatus]|nr:hypothetical protein BDQ17DRAFT_1331771 [Cyathus striatus]